MSTQDVIDKYENDYNQCTIRYGDMKKQLAEDMVKFIAPIREKAAAIRNDEKYLKEIDEIYFYRKIKKINLNAAKKYIK